MEVAGDITVAEADVEVGISTVAVVSTTRMAAANRLGRKWCERDMDETLEVIGPAHQRLFLQQKSSTPHSRVSATF